MSKWCKVVKYKWLTYNFIMKKNKIFTISLYILLIAFIMALFVIYYFSTFIGPGLIKSASLEVNRITSIIINNGVRKYLSNNSELEIVDILRNGEKIEVIRYNTENVNKISMDISNSIEQDINYLILGDLEKIDFSLSKISDSYYDRIDNGLVFGISIGNITGNSLLANIGPIIPLKIEMVSNVNVEVKNKITEYGMNNALMEVFIEIKVSPVIVMPFLSKEISVINKVPLVTEIIQGDIPDSYFGRGNS